MSGSHDHDHDDDGHGHDHAHAFDPEPPTEKAPDEPSTPAWIPVLGACLFLVGGVTFLVRFSDASPAAAVASAAASLSAPARATGSAARPTPPQDPAKRKEMLDEQKKRLLRNVKSGAVAPPVQPSAGQPPAGQPAGPRPRPSAAP